MLRRLAPIALAIAGALPASIYACNGSTDASIGGPTSQPGGDGGASEDGATPIGPIGEDAPTSFIVDSAPPDTFVPLNSFDASDIPEGGTKVSPGVIGCAGTTCNAFAANQCCVGSPSICQAASVSCGAAAVSVTCNEAADCQVGKVCCGTTQVLDAGNAAMSAQCAASCPAPPHAQLCRTNGECPDGGACVIQKCSDGRVYELCGVYASPDDGGTFSCTPQ